MNMTRLFNTLVNLVDKVRERLGRNEDVGIDVDYFVSKAVYYHYIKTSNKEELIIVTSDGLILSITENAVKVDSIHKCE